jgi:hypothetical protein
MYSINFLNYMRRLLGRFNAKPKYVQKKPTTGNKKLHEIGIDNGIRVLKVDTSKNFTVKSTKFPHRNIHKLTWTSPDGKTHNHKEHISIESRRHSNVLDVR